MIQAKDLRVGNFIRYSDPNPDDAYVIQVNAVSEYNGVIIPVKDINGMEGEEWDLESFEPIPLDEGWLIRAGFEKSVDFNFGNPFMKINNYEALRTNSKCGGGDYLFFTNGYRIPCKYVHQLQNLYYALTGTELEFKPK